MTNSSIQAVLNFTDPLNGSFIVNPYATNGTDSPITNVLDATATNANTSLLFFGKGHPNYGPGVQTDILNILESFSGGTAPVNAISGQLWYQRYDVIQTSTGWFVWNDSTAQWSAITVSSSSTAPSGAPSSGNQYQFNSTTNTLYYGVVSSTSDINGQWIQRAYSINSAIGNIAGQSTPVPQKQLRVYTGISWQVVGDVFTSSAAPMSPETGTLWYDTNSGALNIYTGSAFTPLLTAGSILPITDGGTGASTASGALNNLLPSQSGNTGKILTTDGANASWQPPAASEYTGTVTSVAVAAGSIGVSVSGSPITTTGTITITLGTELQGLTQLNTTGYVERTAVGTYQAVPLTSSTITTALGYTPLNAAGGTLTGALVVGAGGTITGLPSSPGADQTAAVSKTYVDNSDITSVGFSNTTLALYTGAGGTLTTNISFGPTNSPAYTPISGEMLASLPVSVGTVDSALHNLDQATIRRTRLKRFVQYGVEGQTTYDVPQYQVGSNKLYIYVDGIKWLASTFGYQRVLFNSTSMNTAGINRLTSSTATGLTTTTTYDFKISVDGTASTDVTVTGSGINTFGGLVTALNSQLSALSHPATAVLEDDNAITIYSNYIGATATSPAVPSSITLATGTTDLFSAIQFFDKLGTTGAAGDPDQQSGANYGYSEVGTYGSLASTITISSANPALPNSSNIIEAVVIGSFGSPLYDN